MKSYITLVLLIMPVFVLNAEQGTKPKSVCNDEQKIATRRFLSDTYNVTADTQNRFPRNSCEWNVAGIVMDKIKRIEANSLEVDDICGDMTPYCSSEQGNKAILFHTSLPNVCKGINFDVTIDQSECNKYFSDNTGSGIRCVNKHNVFNGETMRCPCEYFHCDVNGKTEIYNCWVSELAGKKSADYNAVKSICKREQ